MFVDVESISLGCLKKPLSWRHEIMLSHEVEREPRKPSSVLGFTSWDLFLAARKAFGRDLSIWGFRVKDCPRGRELNPSVLSCISQDWFLQHRSFEQAPWGHCRPSQRIWILIPFRFPFRGSPPSYNSEALPTSLWLLTKTKSPECINRRDQENAHKSRPTAQPVPPSPSVPRECFLQGRARCIMKACHLGAKTKSVSPCIQIHSWWDSESH